MKHTIIGIISALSIMSVANESQAGAWALDKGRTNTYTSGFYALPYKYNSNLNNEDAGGAILTGDIQNKISYWGISERAEYGYRNGLTVFAGLNIANYQDRITVFSREDTDPLQSFSVTTDYYMLTPEVGVRKELRRGDYDALSVEGTIYPGDIIARNRLNHLEQTFALGGSLLYARSFNIPFGAKDRPEYGNYIDTEAGYILYPKGPHHEFVLNATVGLRPIKKYTFGFGLYNTFNGFNYTDRPHSLSAIDANIDALTASAENKDYMKGEVRNQLKDSGNNSYHQINFKIGYDLDASKTVYVESFHNIFKDTAFKYNTIYLSLDWTF